MTNQIYDRIQSDFNRVFRQHTRRFIVYQLDDVGRFSQQFRVDAKLHDGGGLTNSGLPYSETTNYDAEVELLLENRVEFRVSDEGERSTRIKDPVNDNEYRIVNSRESGNIQTLEVLKVPESDKIA